MADLSSEDLEFGAALERANPGKDVVEVALELGARACRAGRLQEALHLLSFATRMRPGHAPAWLNHAVALYLQKDFAGSLADLDRALEEAPDYVLAYTNRASLYSEQGNFDKAAADYTQAIALTTDDAVRYACYLDRAVCRFNAGDLPSALSDCEAAIRLNPKAAAAYANRGGVRQALGDLAGALEDCSRVIEIEPESDEAYFNRALIHAAGGDWQKAEDDYTASLERQPARAAAYGGRGLARLRLRRDAGAEQDFAECRRRDPSSPRWLDREIAKVMADR